MTRVSSHTAPLKVAIAGAGMISWFHLIAWRNLGSRVRLVAICDPDAERAGKRAAEFGIAKIYQDRETHAAWVEAAAARGIDVLCQKPMTPTLAESEALVRRVGDKMRLMVHENWRFRPWYRVLKSWIDEGALGEIVLGRMAMINSGVLPDAEGVRAALVRQPFMQHEARFMIAEVLIHHLDTMRFLCGALRVAGARANRTVADITGETVASIFLETATGAPVIVNGTMAAAGYPPRAPDRLEIVGTKASIVFEDNTLRLLGPAPRSQSFDNERGYQASFDGVMAHFVDCLDSGAPFETGPEDNLETLRLVEHAYWAAGRHDPHPKR
jgi:predicted dehydrogenase